MKAKAPRALVYVDAVQLAPHRLVDVQAIGCDFLVCSPYKFFGPHQGVLWGKAELLNSLSPYKVRPADDTLPSRFETGTLSHEGMAGTLGAVEYLAWIGTSLAAPVAPRRARASGGARSAPPGRPSRAYERELTGRLVAGLQRLPGIVIQGITDPAAFDRRVPTVSFIHDRLTPPEMSAGFGREDIFVWDGHNYALEVISHLGPARERRGAARRPGALQHGRGGRSPARGAGRDDPAQQPGRRRRASRHELPKASMSQRYPHLFSPFRLRGVEIRNRILSTGHDTDLGRHGLPSEALIAYQRARAKGGVGLIIVQVVAVHETARYTSEVLMGTSDAHIPAFRPLFQAIRAEGTTAFVQLFHPGRELLGRRDGILQAAYAPSSAPTERFRIVPRAFSTGEVEEIIEGYGQAARRMAEAGARGRGDRGEPWLSPLPIPESPDQSARGSLRRLAGESPALPRGGGGRGAPSCAAGADPGAAPFGQ